MYLLDTNVLSEFVRKKPHDILIGRLSRIPAASLFTATICVMELRFGALRRGPGSDLWSKIQERILSKVRCLEFGYKEAMVAAEVLHELHSIGQPIGIEDIMIGAVALSNRLTVVTANTRHLSRIPNLHVENWLL